ncbi:MAG TPA: hypothetical protein VJN67_10990 [Stellaceae bacterium]|nr:hypothetical protein [Stellaceae bacterium]
MHRYSHPARAVLFAILLWLSGATASVADTLDLTGTWSFSDEKGIINNPAAKLVLVQKDGQLTGQFEGSTGGTTWDVKGSVASDSAITLMRYVSIGELQGNGLPPDVAKSVVARQPADRADFMRDDVSITYDSTLDMLNGDYGDYHAIYDKDTHALDDLKRNPITIHLVRELRIPFSPEQARQRYKLYDLAFTAQLDEIAARGATEPLYDNTALRNFQYRRKLARRYLQIDGIYTAGTTIEFPGIDDPNMPKVRKIALGDLFTICMIYGQLLADKVPMQTGSFSNKLVWNDAKGSRIYFDTEQEESRLNTALTYKSIQEFRAKLRRTFGAAVSGTLALAAFIPGENLPTDIYILTTGRNIAGQPASRSETLWAVADFGLQISPIVVGVLRANAVQARIENPLINELRNVSELKARLDAAGGNALTKEAIMTAWIGDFDRVMGMKSQPLVTSKQAFSGDGAPLAQRGLDSYATPAEGRAGMLATIRELKRLQDFDGQWSSADAAGLKGDTPVKIPYIHDSQVRADQASWSWIVDRAIKAHRYGLDNNLPEQTAAARELLVRFSNDRLARQVIVMTDEGEIFVSRQAKLSEICKEAPDPASGKPLTVEQLKKAVIQYLADNSR